MKGAILLGTVVALASQTYGAHLLPAFHGRAPGVTSSMQPVSGIPLTSIEDSQYLVNITLGGQPFTCHIDTGSSDLWVIPDDSTPLTIVNETQVFINVSYVDTGGLFGFVNFAELRLGGYSIPSQAFINPNGTTHVDQLLNGGGSERLFNCRIGLGFDLLSRVNVGVFQAFPGNTTIGQTPLSNIFAQNPSLPNNLDIHLQRTNDLEHTDKGFLLIGEHSAEHGDIIKQPILAPVTDRDSDPRWAVGVDAVHVNGHPLTFVKSIFSSLQNSSKLVGVLDTGCTDLILPGEMVTELFNIIPNSFSKDGEGIIIDCLTPVNLSITMGGIEYHIHPLDLTYITQMVVPINGKDENVTVCTSRIDSVKSSTSNGFDISMGDVFLRNVIASFNFGNWTQFLTTGDPTNGSFVQLLPLTDQADAWSEFLTTRTANLKSLPRVLSVDEFRAAYYEHENSTDHTGPSNSTNSPDATHSSISNPASEPSETLIASGGVAKLASTSDESFGGDSQLVSLVQKYGPVLIGLLASNVLIGIILVAVGVAACLRKQGTKSRNISPSYAPVRFKEADSGVDGAYQD